MIAIPAPTLARINGALTLATQAKARYDELLLTAVESLGFNPQDAISIDLSTGVISCPELPVATDGGDDVEHDQPV